MAAPASPPAMSLLAAVRSHLAADWDSESSQTDTLEEPEEREQKDSKIEIKPEVKPDSEHEPFPDYEEEQSSSADEESERAYKITFTAAMQEEIRIEAVDPNIVLFKAVVEKKAQSLDSMKESLSHPQLVESTRVRFIALTNMIILLENTLFSEGEENFLNFKAVADAQSIATVFLNYVSWADALMRDLVQTAENVTSALLLLFYEDVPLLTRYRRMAKVVSAYLKKPRRIEQTLLSKLLDLYDEWVHNTFLRLRNTQIAQEVTLDIGRLQLTRTLHAIWEVLSRAIESYANYRDALHIIKSQFFASVTEGAGGSSVARCFEED
ncbi:hypothetical protein N7466_006865 [Penicillium verhagenii]|uniref:uncharacterized protein n=1 Tax=Penicillium verhagenii TaxID=1562060 RepID=UPI002545A15D|nr:uncharacterized protein N7466_006865 [Penicillium verhagenii]KAJ5927909.1 hypothetical protein N7466_006865 [Penicillium verhagenii]